MARWSELNWQLHGCLYEDAHRSFLVGMIRLANDRLERYLRTRTSSTPSSRSPATFRNKA